MESDNENEKNFYVIHLKDFQIKNEFQDISFHILNNIEVNLSIKVNNIIGGGGFASRMSMFKKRYSSNIEVNSGVISTGVKMQDRLKFFANKGLMQAPPPESAVPATPCFCRTV